MTSLSNIKLKDIIKFVTHIGYKQVRQKGSHVRFYHDNKRAITIPVHGSRPLKTGLLKKLLNDMEITPSALIKFIK